MRFGVRAAAFLAEMLKEALQRIARHNLRKLEFLACIGCLGCLHLDRYDCAPDLLDNIGKRRWGDRRRSLHLRRFSARGGLWTRQESQCERGGRPDKNWHN